MNKIKHIIKILPILFCFTQCDYKSNNCNYFIIPKTNKTYHLNYKNDTITASLVNSNDCYYYDGYRYYSNFVIILDSTNKVFLYQTEEITSKRECKINSSDLIWDYPSPYFIGLSPNHLISFNSNCFVEFLLQNSDILKLDTTNKKRSKTIYIVSNTDTIKNAAFYDLFKLIIKKYQLKRNYFSCYLRTPTEEEKEVMYYKKNHLQYNPTLINWSSNFIDGNTKPFSQKYDSITKYTVRKVKAIDILKPLGYPIHGILK